MYCSLVTHTLSSVRIHARALTSLSSAAGSTDNVELIEVIQEVSTLTNNDTYSQLINDVSMMTSGV